MATRIPFKNLLKAVVFVRLQIISYYIKRHSTGLSRIGAVPGELPVNAGQIATIIPDEQAVLKKSLYTGQTALPLANSWHCVSKEVNRTLIEHFDH